MQSLCASAKWNQRVNGLFIKWRHSDIDEMWRQVYRGLLLVIIIKSKCNRRLLECTALYALGDFSSGNTFILNRHAKRQKDYG